MLIASELREQEQEGHSKEVLLVDKTLDFEWVSILIDLIKN